MPPTFSIAGGIALALPRCDEAARLTLARSKSVGSRADGYFHCQVRRVLKETA